ncbi:DUF6714 family protein [Ralstonia solanacearum species complex bacterium KE056]|uniref:DUF6714 family protein n=1 Tax=Ralstonia solanacearum species complex TaxID=3116862 RepID=UPI001E55E3FA|nr:DUF6714 family protein [Ralstonia pseudosolanacearum]
MDKSKLEKSIANAFADVEVPPDWALVRSHEGPEAAKIEQAFHGRSDWRTMGAHELDIEPALSLFSDEAWRYYLPAFMIHDIYGRLAHEEVVFHLTVGLTDEDRNELSNPRRYGARTRWDGTVFRCSVFSVEQAKAIVEYLLFKVAEEGERGYFTPHIRQALSNYWLVRAESKVE